MNNFYKFIVSQIKTAVTNSLTTSDEPIRVLFSGIPKYILGDVFLYLIAENKSLVVERGEISKAIPVLLIDSSVTHEPNNLDSGRCSNSHTVTVRNSKEGSFLILHDIDESIHQSVKTAANRICIFNLHHNSFEEWIEEPFINQILEYIYFNFHEKEREIVEKAVKTLLIESWESDQRNRDRRAVWNELETIFNQVEKTPNSFALFENIGVPSIEDNDITNAIKLPERISQYFADNGFDNGIEQISNELSEDDIEIKGALIAFINSISVNCLLPSEFSDRPMANYALARKEGGEAWWSVLTDKVWLRLLGGATGEPDYCIAKISCLKTLFNPVTKSHPEVVSKGISFLISPEKEQEPFELKISRAAGNKTLQPIGSVTVEDSEVEWHDDSSFLEHDFFIKYQFDSPAIAKPITFKVIDLYSFKPQVTLNSRSATKITPFKFKPKKGKVAKKNNEGHFECQIELNGVGSHTLDLHYPSKIKLPEYVQGYSGESGEDIGIKNITPSGDEHAVCLIEASENCAYEFELDEYDTNITRKYIINVTVSEYVPKGVSSEFRKLVIESSGSKSALKVDVRNSMLSNLEDWILKDENSFYPLVLGTGIKERWTKPKWDEQPIISEVQLFLDPRPSFESIKSRMPEEFFKSRNYLRSKLNNFCEEHGDSLESINFAILYLDEDFHKAINEYILNYYQWLKSDYETAIWSDIIAIHSEESGNNCLSATPDAILMSPFHPVRIAWQCNAQLILEEAIKKESFAPSSGVIDPSVFPDCIALPCLDANSLPVYKGYAAIRVSSDYWTVLWGSDAISNVNNANYETVFSTEFGLTIDGMAQGFSVQQVKRSLDDVRQLACAKSTLSISLTSDTAGHSSCNAGVEQWCEENLGEKSDEWLAAGANSLKVYDNRPTKSQPEPAILASLTARSGTNVRWYTQKKDVPIARRDLSIIDHLQTMNNEFGKYNFNTAIDPTGLFRKSIKHSFSNQNMFLAESRVGHFSTSSIEEDDSIRNIMMLTLEAMEYSCIEHSLFDGLAFAPNLKTLEDSLDNTDFCAVSSSTIDASCFNMPNQTSLLWDYELPKYSSDIGQSSGFYLLAQESQNMHEALNNVLVEFKGEGQVNKVESTSLLREISKRGMPTLKKLTSGGTSSLGEIGMLVALRLLQTDFQVELAFEGLLPVSTDSHVNLIIPADIFQPRFDSLRSQLKLNAMERPDLIVMSFKLMDSEVVSLKLTPIEVKARTGTMSSEDRISALKQAKVFSEFLEIVKSKAETDTIWGVAWREMLASWVDYGFRVYGEVDNIKKAGTDWSKLHQAITIKLLNNAVSISIDSMGRLVTVENQQSGEILSTINKSFKDTVVLSHKSAAYLLGKEQQSVINGIQREIGFWNLLSEVSGNDEKVIPIPKVTPHKEYEGASPGELSDGAKVIGKVATPQVENEELCAGINFKVGESLDRFEDRDAVFYPGNTALNNINIGVVGDLGTGKTQLLKALVYQLVNTPENNRGEPPKVLILDYKRDFSDLKNENCKFISKANVKVIKPKDLPLNMFNTSDSSAATPWLDRYSFFRDMLSKIFSAQKPIQDAYLKKAVKQCFKEIEGRDPTIYEVFDAYEVLVEGKIDTTYTIMSDIIDYEIFESNPEKIKSFESFFDGTIAIDLSGFSDDKVKNMIIVIFLNFYYDYMKKVKKRKFLGEDPQTRFIDSYLLVDEAHNIMPYEFPVLSKLLLQGREFGVGVIMASQYFSHFKTNKENYMEPIQSWFVHKVPGIKASDLDRIGIPNAGQSMINRVASLEVFESLCKTLGQNGDFIKGIPFYKLD